MSSAPIIRVLIVDDVQESRDNIERLLSFEPDFRVVGKAARGEEGIELALRLQPHVVLLDQTLPDLDGFEVAAAITARAPGIGVILLALDPDPDMLRRAMLAGAREYLTKPFSYEEFVEAVRRVGRLANPGVAISVPIHSPSAPERSVRETAGRDGRVIAVLGAKGGRGTNVPCDESRDRLTTTKRCRSDAGGLRFDARRCRSSVELESTAVMG